MTVSSVVKVVKCLTTRAGNVEPVQVIATTIHQMKKTVHIPVERARRVNKIANLICTNKKKNDKKKKNKRFLK